MNNNESKPVKSEKKNGVEIDRILIPVITAITGIFLPYAWKSVFDPLLTAPNTAPFIISFLICLVVLSAVSVFIVKINEVHNTQKTLLQETKSSQNRIFDSEGALFKEIRKSQSELIKKIGVTAKLLTYGDGGDYQNGFQYPSTLIENATSILALDYHGDERVPVNKFNEPKEDYKNWYELLNTTIETKPGIEYHRILQLKGGISPTLDSHDHFDKTVIKHYKTILDVKKKNDKVTLRTCPIFLSNVCMLVIDHRYLIWEMPTMENGEDFHFDMDMVIEDPSECFIRKLENQILARMGGYREVTRIK